VLVKIVYGNTIAPVDVRLLADGRSVVLTYAPLPANNYDPDINAPAVTDRVGNALGASAISQHFSLVAANIVWINPAGGDWDDPNNWDAARVQDLPTMS
jgi:hypothetical protein